MTTRILTLAPDVPAYTQRTVLDGREYVLRFTHNQREQRWYLSIMDQDESPIAMGIKVVCNFPLLRRLVDARAPRGELMALDFSGLNDPADLGDLGRRVQLVYFEAADLTAAAITLAAGIGHD